jgi:hypothetical protein
MNVAGASQSDHTAHSSLCFSGRGLDAAVFLKGLLSEAVKCQRGHGAFETRRGHAPRAAGASPAGEMFVLDPDHSFVHTSTFFLRMLDWGSQRREESTESNHGR